MRINRVFTVILAAATVAVPMFAASAQTPAEGSSYGFAARGDSSGRMLGRAPGVFGQVTAVIGNTLTITDQRTGTTYTVDASAAKITKDGQGGSVANLAVGDNVMVEGTVSGTSVTATAIRDGMGGRLGQGGLGDRNNGQRPAVVGKITAINGSTLTVTKNDNMVDTVDASQAKIDKNRSAITVADLAVGDNVMVEGTVSGTTVTATAIHDGMGWQLGKNDKPAAVEGNGQPVIMGTVATVNGSIITIKNNGATEYSVDVSAAKITKDGQASTAAAIAVGDTVVVQGTVNGTTVTAASVNDQTAIKHEGGPSGTANGQAGNHGRANGLSKQTAPGFFGRIWGALAHFFGF